MKAIVSTKSGPADVLQLKEVERPKPGEHEVLVRVHTSTVTRGDVVLRKMPALLFIPLRLMGLRRKKIPGHEFAGEIEETGSQVTRFRKGDRVFGTTTGLSVGANAEYVCLPEEGKNGLLVKMGDNQDFSQAAVLPVGGMTALYLLQKGNIRSGQKVLIYGASGSVGTYAVQLAKHFGAQVSGVCSSKNLELVRSLGADQVIDYTREDFSQHEQTYDLIFDAAGKTLASFWKDRLKENGLFVSVQSITKESLKNLNFLRDLLEAGKIRAVIDRSYPLQEIAEAHRYVESGHKRGNVLITVIPDSENPLGSPA